MKAYQSMLLVLAMALAALAAQQDFGNPLAVIGLCAVAAVAERGRVKLGTVTEASISLLPTVFAAAVFGPLAAMAVAAASLLGDFPAFVPVAKRAQAFARGAPYLKWGIYTCTRCICAGVAGFAANASTHVVGSDIARLIVATVIAAVVAEPLDVAFAALTLKLRGGRPLPFLRMFAPILFAAVSLYAPVVALLSVAYEDVSPWTIALFFLPALAAQRVFALYQEQRRLTDELVEANTELEKANVSFATALVATLDARDRYTAGHSAAVAIYARDIAARMELSGEEQKRAHLCGLVHDVGKIGLPAGLLEKPGALTLEERREMQRHSEIGERILAKVETYAEIASVVRNHHERMDGQGYPDGLAGREIPLLSRIVAVADAYNAMTSDRPYRDAMPHRVARARLVQAVDSQFDSKVVIAFELVLESANEAYRTGTAPEFSLDRQEQEVELNYGDWPGVSPVPVAISA